MKPTTKTKVIFRYWENDVIAIFPEDADSPNPRYCESYQHVGGHGSCDPNAIVEVSRPATPEEYASLKRELESDPYFYELKVIQRLRYSHYLNRQAQLKKH